MGFFYAYKVKSFIRKGQERTMPDNPPPPRTQKAEMAYVYFLNI